MKIRSFLAPLVQKVMVRVLPAIVDPRLSQLRELPCPAGRVLFLGDSITDHSEWSEWFPELLCLNRGVAGDTVDGVRKRLGWTVNAPVAISLLIGTNDLSGIGLSVEPVRIAEQTRLLVAELRAAAPDALLLVSSVMPRTAAFRDAIHELNDHYKKIAADAGATYLDLWPAMADAEGRILAELSYDDLHLTGPGYRVWVNALRPHLARFAIVTQDAI